MAKKPGMDVKFDDDDEEEDFFSMVGKSNESPPVVSVHLLSNSSEEIAANSVAPTLISAVDGPREKMGSELSPFLPFESALERFYAVHNISNLSKIAYLAEKFNDRRWELWEQLSMKYRLCPRESVQLWADFNYPGLSEVAALNRLFGVEVLGEWFDETRPNRMKLWTAALQMNESSSDEELYSKYLCELVPSAEDEVILLDVRRTHQEMGFFQEVCLCGWSIFMCFRNRSSNLCAIFCVSTAF